jgi:hypothetical protein
LPYRSTPAPQTFPGQATRKRQAAERHEAEAIRLRAEALELDKLWREHVRAERDRLTKEQAS